MVSVVTVEVAKRGRNLKVDLMVCADGSDIERGNKEKGTKSRMTPAFWLKQLIGSECHY